MTKPIESTDPQGEEFVRIALGAAQHEPSLVWAYFGPEGWLEHARTNRESADSLLKRAKLLCADAERADNEYVRSEIAALVVHLERMNGDLSGSWSEQVRRMLDVDKISPSAEELEKIDAEVRDLARDVFGRHGDAVRAWEQERSISGEDKWDVAIQTYMEGRQWTRRNFPLALDEDLELGRDTGYHSSVHMNWKSGSTMRLGINPLVPRPADTVRFEVAHNGYPGDYLRLATLAQHAFGKRGEVAACIKVKDAPESVISEGIEDTAYLRLNPTPGPELSLAIKLEWLRRGVAANAAIRIRDQQASKAEVGRILATHGFMDDQRVENELRLIDHPVWGPYRATYWAGRELVEEADRIGGGGGTGAGKPSYLAYLFGELHSPRTFIAQLKARLATPSLA